MVITVTCPSCHAAFPVDPKKIPEGGVKGRCTQCGHIFRVEKPAERPPVAPPPELPEPTPTPPPLASEPPRTAPDPVETAPSPPEPTETVTAPPSSGPPPLPPLDPPAEPAQPVTAPPPSEPPPLPPPEPAAPTEPVQGFTFGKRDPTDKAKRLARVLVSDMIMYNAERHQTALAHGTLVQDFDEEIQKSWKEYVEQVGEEMANGEGRKFWVDALNDILAKGKEVF